MIENPVNPWLAEKLGAKTRTKRTPEQALYRALREDPFLQTLRANLNLPSVIQDGLYWCHVDTVADLLQFTEEEFAACAAREGFDPKPVRRLLRQHGYTLFSAPQRTWKMSALPVMRSQGKGGLNPWMLESPGGFRSFDISRPTLNDWWCGQFFAGYAHIENEEKVVGEYLHVTPVICRDQMPMDYSEFFQSVKHQYDAYEEICRFLEIPVKIARPSIPEHVSDLEDFTNDRFLALWRNCCRIMTDVFERTNLFRKSTPGDYLVANDEGKLNIAEGELEKDSFQLLLITFVENKIDFENVLIYLDGLSKKPRKRNIGDQPDPINPWLVEIMMAYRSHHDDASLRNSYNARLEMNPDKSWNSFLAEAALEDKTAREPFLLTTRKDFGFSAQMTDLMRVLEVDIVADLLQFTRKEMKEMCDQAGESVEPVVRFLTSHGYRLYDCDEYTLKYHLPRASN